MSRPVSRRPPPEPEDRPNARDWAQGGTAPQPAQGYSQEWQGQEAPGPYPAPVSHDTTRSRHAHPNGSQRNQPPPAGRNAGYGGGRSGYEPGNGGYGAGYAPGYDGRRSGYDGQSPAYDEHRPASEYDGPGRGYPRRGPGSDGPGTGYPGRGPGQDGPGPGPGPGYDGQGGYGAAPPAHGYGGRPIPGVQPGQQMRGGHQDGDATALLNGRPWPPDERDRPSFDDWRRGPGQDEFDFRHRNGPGDPNRPGGPAGPGGPGGPGRPGKKPRKHRIRRLWRLRTVKIIIAVFALFFVWVGASLGSAITANNGGSLSSKLSEWARDHYLGPLVTFGEWLTYQPPKVGGKPSFSLATGENAKKLKFKKEHGFVAIVPKTLSSPAGKPLSGEGIWRLVETVKGQPALYTTFLRPDNVHTSYVAGLISMDQRLLTFSLHPGAEDPGPGNWKSSDYIPSGQRKGLMATFNGGFKLDVAGGGFYLNGLTKGTLTNGAASVVYYKDGTIKVGTWGRDVRMSPNVVGVRQNLKLIVDQGRIPTDVNENVLSSWGATLGGAYYVWRSGIGITKDGRVIFVYGPALDVKTLAGLLQRAGAVEAMQLDINPFWTTFMSYSAGDHPSDPTPNVLLPDQMAPASRYYSVWSRDFTAVYAR